MPCNITPSSISGLVVALIFDILLVAVAFNQVKVVCPQPNIKYYKMCLQESVRCQLHVGACPLVFDLHTVPL